MNYSSEGQAATIAWWTASRTGTVPTRRCARWSGGPTNGRKNCKRPRPSHQGTLTQRGWTA